MDSQCIIRISGNIYAQYEMFWAVLLIFEIIIKQYWW